MQNHYNTFQKDKLFNGNVNYVNYIRDSGLNINI